MISSRITVAHMSIAEVPQSQIEADNLPATPPLPRAEKTLYFTSFLSSDQLNFRHYSIA